jgi:NAD(P)-dependent dehydrogenase (short-subunit alcohol dehydrogenase family)
MMKRFENRVVVITGGARGIGRASAQRFAREGAQVALLDIDEAAAEETAALIGGLAFACNVSDRKSVQHAVQRVAERWGRLDVLFANAGIYRGGALVELTLENWQSVLDVNLTGVMLSCQAVAPTMVAQKSGSIVVMSSMAAKTSWAETAAYSAAKTGAIGLVRSIARELGPHNINCNAVCLGHADTEMLRDVDRRVCVAEGWEQGAYLESLVDDNPMHRLCRLEEVAGLVAYLASDEARYINGQAIEIDGGLVLS